MRRSFLLLLPLAALVLLASAGCDSNCLGGCSKPEEPTFQTRFLGVRVEPNPVAVGDTATFTAVIEDSLDTRFEFFWLLPGPNRTTNTNRIRWVAEVAPGRYSIGIEADNGGVDGGRPVNTSFTIDVVAEAAD